MYVNKFTLKRKRTDDTVLQPSRKKSRKNENDEEDEDVPILPFSPALLEKDDDESVFQLDNHIYFTSDVSMKSINKLAKLIYNANKEFELLVSTTNHMANITPKPIYLHISSVGGDLFAGFRAVDLIQNSRIPIYTVVEGYAISSGSLMYLAGKKKFMSKNSYLLIMKHLLI